MIFVELESTQPQEGGMNCGVRFSQVADKQSLGPVRTGCS